jgi:hypothetical protein
MHDLDRAMFEIAEYGGGTIGETDRESGETSGEQQEFLEVLGELTGGSAESGHEAEAGDGLARSAAEAELAGELLEVQSAAELDRFLGKLIGRAAGAVRDFARSDTGRALGGILKKAAGDALPVVGQAVGGAIGPEYAGAGRRVGKAAGAVLGLELEGLTGEDREFEAAKAFVRFADAAARHAAQAPPGAPARAVATAAATTAARRYAPGLVGALPAGAGAGPRAASGGAAHPQSGRWERRGGHVVIFGL